MSISSAARAAGSLRQQVVPAVSSISSPIAADRRRWPAIGSASDDLSGRLVDGVLGLADAFLGRADGLVGHALGLKPLVADGLADRLLHGADALLGRALDAFFAHDRLLGFDGPSAAAGGWRATAEQGGSETNPQLHRSFRRCAIRPGISLAGRARWSEPVEI